jgi:DNA polymerase III delta prime subunit
MIRDEKYELIINAYLKDRLSHAYLLTGDLYGGQLTLAKKIAKFLLCEDKDKVNTRVSCNVCGSCKLFEGNTHPDFMHVFPDEDKTIIGVDKVRSVIEKCSKRPYYGEKSIFLIEECAAMNQSGHNALLKTLEEPGPSVIFLMTTSRKNELLDTILSRVTQINVDSLDRGVLKKSERYSAEMVFSGLSEIIFYYNKYKDTNDLIKGLDLKAGFRDCAVYIKSVNSKKIDNDIKKIIRVFIVSKFMDALMSTTNSYYINSISSDVYCIFEDFSSGKANAGELYSLILKYSKARLLKESDSFIIDKIFKFIDDINRFEGLINVSYKNVLSWIALKMEESLK